jgi:hypothetical protein
MSTATPERRRWAPQVAIPQMWASLAITTMWLAVLFDSLWGPDMVFANGDSAQMTRIPSGIVVAFFAYLGTRVIVRHWLERDTP